MQVYKHSSSVLRCVFLVFFLWSVITDESLNAQSLLDQNLATVSVDDLSDQQIVNYIQRAKENGISEIEAYELARKNGLPESEISKMRVRVLGLLGTSGNTASSTGQVTTTGTPRVTNGAAYVPFTNVSTDLSEKEKEVFGIKIFRKKGLSFAPNLNLPTPVDYQLGPDDVLVVNLWGTTQKFFSLTVSREGTVRPDNLGPIYVNGLTIKAAEERIVDHLAKIFSGLKKKGDKEPTIFHQVSLGNIRTINVEVVGAAELPGIFSLPSLATVYTALHAAGGPNLNGSFRDIKLIRNNKLLQSIDVYSFLTEGIKRGDRRLMDGDVIVIPTYKTRVEISGDIKTPAKFELKEGETFDDLLHFANGFTDRAYTDEVSLRRNGDKERELLDVKKADFKTFQPQNGDTFEVGTILNKFSNRVVIKGAVLRVGEYQLTEGMTLKNIIDKAQGLRGDAYLERVTVYRILEDFSQTLLSVDLKAIMEGRASDLILQNEDIITINSLYDLKEEYFVEILGEVGEGGVYPFFQNMNIKDLIVLAGGLRETASGALIEVARRRKVQNLDSLTSIISVSISKDLSISGDENISLEPYDQIFIRKAPGYSIQEQLTIEGEVMAPGPYSIAKKDEKISDIIKRASGLTSYAYVKGAILIRKTEFQTAKTDNFINSQSLDALRNKLLASQSQSKNRDISQLLERIEILKERAVDVNDQDVRGRLLKKDIIQRYASRDSLVGDLYFSGVEPVSLNLEEIMKNPGSKYDLTVKPGDIISIPSQLETVRVTGEVTSALNVRYDKSAKFKDYIQRSGGYLASSKRGRSFVQYPNGDRKGVKRFLWIKKYPKIEPGSTIVVGKKPDRNPVSLQSFIAITSSLATLALLVDRISN